MHLLSPQANLLALLATLISAYGFDGIISWMMRRLRQQYGPVPPIEQKYLGLPRILGYFERVMYIWALVSGTYSFIAVWLAMKTVGGVQIWNQKEPGREAEGRASYQRYLIGTLASLMASVITYYVVFLGLGSTLN